MLSNIEVLDVYGIGNLLIDIVARVTDEELSSLALHKGTMHLTDEAERSRLIEFLRTKEVSYSCGGDCPNTMIALASFGVEAALAGRVGDDEFGAIYLNQLRELPIRSEVKVGKGSTGSSIILVSPDSERTMNTHLGINRTFCFADVRPQALDEARFLYFTGYLWDTDLQKDAILRTLALAKESGCTIAFDVADPFAVNRNRDEFLRIIADFVDIAFANREEARILFGTDDVRIAVERMAEITRIAVVKNGPAGSLVMAGRKQRGERLRADPLPADEPGTLWTIPVCDQEPIDTTGAGDMYAAGFLYGLVRGMPLFKAGVCASYLASQIIVQRGAQFTPERRAEVAQIIRSGGWDYTR